MLDLEEMNIRLVSLTLSLVMASLEKWVSIHQFIERYANTSLITYFCRLQALLPSLLVMTLLM